MKPKLSFSQRAGAAARILFGRSSVKEALWADAFGDVAGGKAVSETSAMSIPAFNLAVNLISESIAMLPLRLKRREECGEVVIKDHPFYEVFDMPCGNNRPGFTGPMLLKAVIQAAAIHGNAYLEQIRVGSGRKLRLLKPISPNRVSLEIEGESAKYKVEPRQLDGTASNGGVARTIYPPDIIHIRGRYVDSEGWEGISVLHTLRSTLNVCLAQNRHARESLVGGNLKGFISPDAGVFGEQTLNDIGAVFNNPDWDNKIPVISEAMKFTPYTKDNVSQQFDQSRSAQVIEIGRAFNIPPHLMLHVSGISNWGSGLQQMAQAFSKYTLSPWAERIENAFTASLLTNDERKDGLFFEFDFSRLLRGTPNERALFYQTAISSGWMSPAEARQAEGMVEREGCDDLKPVTEVSPPDGANPAGDREPNQPQPAEPD